MAAPTPEDRCDICGHGFADGAPAVADPHRGWLDAGRFRYRWRHQTCNQANAAGQLPANAHG